jgi:Glycosyl hydrolase family 26
MRLASEAFDFWPISTPTTGIVTEDQSHRRSGSASGACAASGINFVEQSITSTPGRFYFYRFALKISALPAATASVWRAVDATGMVLEVALSASGKLELWNAVAAAHPTGTTFTIAPEEWVVVEVMLMIPAAGKGKVAWRTNGETRAAEQEMSVRNLGIIRARTGNIATAAATFYLDDIGINDDQGVTDNTWLGLEADVLPTQLPRYWGADISGEVYGEGREPAPYDSKTWDTFEAHTGKKVGIVHYSDPWQEAGPIWDGYGGGASGKVRARNAIGLKSLGGPSTVLADVISGSLDTAIDTWAEGARAFGRPFFVRPWWEMNGTWYSWGQAKNFVEAWRHLYSRVKAIAPNATFVWCVNVIFGAPSDPFTGAGGNMYPGDEYVDWVGMDGYTGQNPHKALGFRTSKEVFLATYERLQEKAPTKPVMICETGCSEYAKPGGAPEPPKKAEWIKSLLEHTVPYEMPNVRAVLWFNWNINEGGGRLDWQIESSESAEASFAEQIASRYYLLPAARRLGLLTPVPLPSFPQRVAVLREYPPDKLAWRITPPQGAPSRWAADEPLAENVIDDIRLVDEMPGGDKEGSGTLARNPRTPWPDLAVFSDVEVYGPGVEVVGNYRIDKTPKSDGERMAIDPAAVGWSAGLDDDKAVIGPGFIDGRLSEWVEPSIERRLNLKTEGYELSASASSGAQEGGASAPGLMFDFSGVTKTAGNKPGAELQYFGGGVDLARLLFDFLGDGTTTWAEFPALLNSDLWTAVDDPKNLNGATAAQQEVTATASGRKRAALQAFYTGEFTGQMTNQHVYQNVKVLSDHGLALQGDWPNVGFTVSQMLGYAIPLHTPLSADPEDLEDRGYIIGQAWFSDSGPMSQVVRELTKYELLDWFVFGGRRFQLRQPGTYGRNWQAYAGPSDLQEEGEDGTRLWREITVSYQDVDGTTRTVGPPGSNATVEDARLEITDPDHPAVRAELTRKDLLDLKGISTPARALEAGEYWLAEANLLSRSGSATLSDYVMDDRGIFRPVSQLRAGDRVRFPDAVDSSYRKVVRRAYEHNARTVTVDLDAPPEGYEALLERMQADITQLGYA